MSAGVDGLSDLQERLTGGGVLDGQERDHVAVTDLLRPLGEGAQGDGLALGADVEQVPDLVVEAHAPEPTRRLRLLKVHVQPVFVIDDGDGLLEVVGNPVEVTGSNWRNFAEQSFSAHDLIELQQQYDAATADPGTAR